MKILTISGSSRPGSSNVRLLEGLTGLLPEFTFERFSGVAELPLYCTEKDRHLWPEQVLAWRKAVSAADALIICTPEYLHNLPAQVKNALEWLTTSGELMHKPVLAITFTPYPPRGEKAMQSLLWSLTALDARIVGQLPLYQNEIQFDVNGHIRENETSQLLVEALQLLK